MLNSYLAATQRLLQNPAAPISLYSTADLTTYINTARGQLAGEGECIRALGTVNTIYQQRNYNFSAVTIGVTGIAGAIHVRSLRYAVGSGYQWISPRGWEWFEFYYLNTPVPDSGAPTDWAQYGQGSAPPPSGSSGSGSFYVNPLPDIVYALTADCVCFPSALATDADPELIPYLWTDAVPYYAAYLALMSAQVNNRMAEAEKMFGLYQTFVQRARQAANPSLLRGLYQQSPNLTQANQLGQGGR